MSVKAARELLLEAARNQTTVQYMTIARTAGLILQGDALSGQLGRLLGEIVRSEIARDPEAPMLSAVALPAHGNHPSQGFFELARELGRLESHDSSAELNFWIAELNRAYAYWENE